MKIASIAYSLIAVTIITYILVIGRPILLPLVLAIIIWFLIKAIRDFVRRIRPGGKRSLPHWLQNVLVFLIIFGVLSFVGKMLSANITRMTQVIPTYEENAKQIYDQLNELLGIDIASYVKEYSGNIDLTSILRGFIASLTDLLGSAFMVFIYVMFILIEETVFPNKLKAIFNTPEKQEKSSALMKKLNERINSYVLNKTLISLITGIVSYVVLVLVGVDFAFFWAFLIFLLNYIPTIGSLIATFFPAVFAILQLGSFTPFIIVLLSVGAVQIVMGNVIEPRLMGSKLNISPLIVILSLIFWSAIWGIIGMILCVPITVILILVFAQFSKTRSVAVLLSGNGKID